MTADRSAMEAHERTGLDAPIARALVKMAIVGAYQQIRLVPLTGGVSSDVFRADIPSGPICVKRALPKLKVAADWRAPVERNHWEVEWMRIAATIVPAAVPEILGEDRESGCFAMAYLPPERYPVWKALLRDGVVDRATAAAVGDALGRIHAATADRTHFTSGSRQCDSFPQYLGPPAQSSGMSNLIQTLHADILIASHAFRIVPL